MNDLVSIIVPVYNVYEYLDECLKSLINQTYKNIEIIVINDGSTDKSLSICEKYTKKDKRIKLINQKNSGLSYTRNIGIKNSKGKYISFIDSDDWVDLSMYDTMLKQAQKDNAEIVVCNLKLIRRDNEENNTYWPEKNNGPITKQKTLSYLFKYPSYAVNKIYKREFLIKNNLCFIKGLLYEDVPFWIQTLFCAKNVSYCINHFYFYRLSREDAITKKKSEKHLDIIKIVNLSKELLEKYDAPKYVFNNFIAWQKQIFVWMYNLLPEDKQSEALHFFDGLDDVIKNGIYKKLFSTKCKVYFCGIKICSFRTQKYNLFQKLFSIIPFFQLKRG